VTQQSAISAAVQRPTRGLQHRLAGSWVTMKKQ
jgi:hypothetical protein